jgi:Na+/H+ antiporter NhaD/arsenite permease-like protein
MLVAIIGLLIVGLIVLCLFRLPLPLRLAVAGVDLIAAAILFAASRQQDSR